MSTQYIAYSSRAGGGVATYPTFSAFPATASDGTLAVALDTDVLYVFNASSMTWLALSAPTAVLSVGPIDSQAPGANGATLNINALIMQSAGLTVPGLVNNAAQSFSGNKTFSGTISASNLSGTNTGDVTLGTANGLSITGQVLSLGLSSTSTTGALSSTDWNTFNNKQGAGSYITALTGDVIAAGPGSAAATVAFVGGSTAANVHTAELTVNTPVAANFVLSGPTTGGSAVMAPRLLVSSDIPSILSPNVLYVNGSRVDAYTPDGTFSRPYLEIQDAIDAYAISALPEVLIQVAPGDYTGITFDAVGISNVVIKGCNSASISGNVSSTLNNDSITSILVDGFLIGGNVNLVGASNNTNFLVTGAQFSNCQIQGAFNVNNAASANVFNTAIAGNVTFTNVSASALNGGEGFTGALLSLVTNFSANAPAGFGLTFVVLESTLYTSGTVTVDAGSFLQIREGTRLGSSGGSITIDGNFNCYTSFIRSNIIINAGGTFAQHGTFYAGTLTVDPAATYLNDTRSLNVGYTPATSGNWNTVPAQVAGALDTLAVSGVAKSQTQNLFLASPNGSSGLPSFRAIVAADLPAISPSSLTLTNNHILVGNASNVATDVAMSGDATIVASGALTIVNSAVTNAKMADMLNNTVKANKSGITAAPSDLALSSVTETGSSVLTITNGSNSVVSASNLTIQVTQSTTSTSGYLSSTDWNTFNNKQSTLTLGDLTDAGTDGIVITGGTGAVIGSGTSIAQHVADATHNGYLSSADWTSFNSKQPAGSYITALTGDATAAGPGSVVLTLATVNAGVGSFGTASSVSAITVNAKGLVTAAANTAIQIVESQVTNLVSDLAAKQSTTLTNAHILVGNVSNVATDVAVTGDVTITNAGVTAIGANKVANSQLAQMAAHTYKGNNTGSTANAIDVTSTQLTADLNLFTSGLQGLVPASGGGTVNFLRADGTFAPVGSTTTVTSENITLSGTDITNQYVDLLHAISGSSASVNSASLSVVGAPIQQKTVDYTVSLTGGSGGVTRITFAGDLATGGLAALVAADILIIEYAY